MRLRYLRPTAHCTLAGSPATVLRTYTYDTNSVNTILDDTYSAPVSAFISIMAFLVVSVRVCGQKQKTGFADGKP
jgi:hypothetical protein